MLAIKGPQCQIGSYAPLIFYHCMCSATLCFIERGILMLPQLEYCYRSCSTVKHSTQQRTHHVLTNTSLHLHVRINLHGTGLCNATGRSVQRSNNFQISPAADSSICIELEGCKSYSNIAKPLECLLTAFIAPALRGRCLHHPPQRPPPRPLALRLKLSRDYK